MPKPIVTLAQSTTARYAVRGAGALLLLFVGLDHYYEYSVDHYSVVPTIGTLFLLNFISAMIVGLALLAPLGRIFGRLGETVLQLAAISGFAIGATSLAALLVSEKTPLFGFMEFNYRPAIIVAIASEAAAAIFLALLFTLSLTAERSSAHASRRRPGRSPVVGAG